MKDAATKMILLTLIDLDRLIWEDEGEVDQPTM